MANDAITDFLARLNPATPRAAAVHGLGAPALKAIAGEIADVGGALPLAFLDAEQRAELEGETPIDPAALLQAAASALADSPGAPEAIGGDADLFRDVAGQAVALRGLVVRAEDVERCGRDGALLLSGEIDDQCRRIVGHLAQSTQTDDGGLLRSRFAAPLRILDELHAGQERAAQGTERKLAPARERLVRARDTAAALQSINETAGRHRGGDQ